MDARGASVALRRIETNAPPIAWLERVLSAPPETWGAALAAANVNAKGIWLSLRAAGPLAHSDEERRRFESAMPPAHWPPLLELLDLPMRAALAAAYPSARACFLASAPWPRVANARLGALLSNCGADVGLLRLLVARFAESVERLPCVLPGVFSDLCADGHFASARCLFEDHPHIESSRSLRRAEVLANACARSEPDFLLWLLRVRTFARKAERNMRYSMLGFACRHGRLDNAECLTKLFAFKPEAFEAPGYYCQTSVLELASLSLAGAVWLCERFGPAVPLQRLSDHAIRHGNAPLVDWISARLSGAPAAPPDAA